jgi:hypothetical protein
LAEKVKYEGSRTIDGLVVTFNGTPLHTYADINSFCPAGFEWGYYGDASKQLAFALLMHHTNDRAISLSLADTFASDVVSNLDNHWTLLSEEIEGFIKASISKG